MCEGPDPQSLGNAPGEPGDGGVTWYSSSSIPHHSTPPPHTFEEVIKFRMQSEHLIRMWKQLPHQRFPDLPVTRELTGREEDACTHNCTQRLSTPGTELTGVPRTKRTRARPRTGGKAHGLPGPSCAFA